jgi:glycosyltransferase involved in cell wall biosynthesis
VRIVQLVETLEVGGLERMAVDLALRQQQAGNRVAVYCLFGAGPMRRELDAATIPVIELHKESRSKAGLVWTLARQLARDRAEVLHGHNPGVHHFAAVAKQLARVPVCLNTRHGAATSQGRPYDERYFRLVERWTDHVVFVCEYARAQLEPRLGYPARKCSVVRNGISTEAFVARAASPGARRPRLRLGTIGRLVPAKGHAVLIDAFSRLAAAVPEASLSIYGYGRLESELREQIRRLGMEQRIRLEGRTDDTAGALAAMDIFVMSSIHEGLPLVILEAMAAGLPIVSTQVGGIPEVAPEGDVAWYCAPGDAESLAAVLRCAAEAPDLALRGGRARELAFSRYAIAQMADAYECLYRRLLAEIRHRPWRRRPPS